MSFLSDYKAALKKLQEEEAPTKKSSSGTKSTKTSKSAGTKSTSKKTVAPKKKSFMEEYEEEKERLITEMESDETVQSRMTVGSVAPVKDEEEDRKWFEKGAFEDGYQFGDVSKTILGTLSDVGENLTAGVLGMGEKIIDAAAYLAPAFNVSQQVQNNPNYAFDIEDYRQQQEDAKKFISKDLYDEEKVAHTLVSGTTYPVRQVVDYSSDDSVLGEKSDALAQSGGQLLGTLGLQAVGVPWWVTSGVTTFGSEAENAMKQGATYEQAGASAAISAGAEILTEKLFGGSGLGEEGLINLDPLTRGISNKLVKTLADYGLDIAAEGSEEVVSEIAGKLGSSLYREERLKDILLSEEAFQDYLDSFIGGGVLGGVMNAGKFVGSAKDGTDYRAELTQNEQKVVDKVYEERLAELKKNGKVTAKQKSQLYEAVQRDMEKGYISTDTIEEVLGDKDYQLYKETVDKEDAILREFEELGNKQNPTLAESHRYAELQRQVADIKQYSSREALQKRLHDSVYQKAQGDRLVESYNERARRGQAFEADVTKYDSKMRETVQRAIDSGTLNNTNRTHELVDFIAKISADKGVPFDFTNNEKINETRFAVEGKIVNGYKTDSGITLNVESPKYLQSTVGHEITHVLEGTEFYDALKTTIFNYAKSKGVYDTRLAEVTEMYKNIEGADVEGELTADLVGDYLFQDSDFVSKLSTENRNGFQKIYDEIKYLYKVATAGSKEARELEKVKRAFDKAYRESGKAKIDTQYSLGYHAGDLGKSEHYAMQSGDRSTGHFGTGTYFVGDEAKISGNDTYGKRPHEAVEFDNYNLYKVRNDKDGYRLHDYLHVLDGGVSQEFLNAAVAGNFRVSDLRSKAFHLADEYDSKKWDDELEMEVSNDFFGASIRAMSEVAEESGLEFQSYDKWLSEQSEDAPKPDDSDYDFYQDEYYDYLKELLVEADKNRNSGYDDFRDAQWELRWMFGEDNVIRALQAVVDHQTAMEKLSYKEQYGQDSNATVFMKALGYEGIDVRGTGLDNTTYGSVIYDLKGKDAQRKAEIGTAKYSLSEADKNHSEAVKNRDWDTAQHLVDEAAKNAGYVKAVYHGTDARFTVFDTDEDSTAREEHAWMADYPSGTIFLAEDYKTADYYGERVMEMYLDTSDIKVFEEPDMYAHRAMDDKYGYEVYNYPVIAVKGKDMTIYATLDNTLVKSSMAATYDDNGNLIPLSERFKHDNPDIRYSLSEETDRVFYTPRGVEVVKNPTNAEYRQMREEIYKDYPWLRGTGEAILRHTYDESGNEYYWNAYEGMHRDVEPYINKQYNTRTSQHWEWWTRADKDDYPADYSHIRYSLSDSDGRQLSEEQSKYFHDSKVKDENGNLQVVYHGSPKDFNTFSLKYLGTNGTAEGYGFYFTDKKHIAEGYSRGYEGQQNGEPGRLFEVYLDIKKPLSDTEVTMTRAQFKKFLTTLNNYVDADGERLDVLSNYGDVEWEGLNKVLNYAMEIEYDGSDSDVNLVHSIINGCGDMKAVFDVLRTTVGYDGIIVDEASWGGDQTIYIAFHPEQIKNVDNLNPTTDPDIRHSLSEQGETPKRYGDFATSGKDVAYVDPNAVNADSNTESVLANAERVNPEEILPDNVPPVETELERLTQEQAELESRMTAMGDTNDYTDFETVNERYLDVLARIAELQESETERVESITDEDAPLFEESTPEVAPVTVDDPFKNRDWFKIGNQKHKAFIHENPEFKEIFQLEANIMLGELQNSTKGRKLYNDALYYRSGGEEGWSGQKRQTSESIAYLIDAGGMTYERIENGLKAIIKGDGAENNADSKHIEFVINDRLLNGYNEFFTDERIPPNQDYINLVNQWQTTKHDQESSATLTDADAPMEVGPVLNPATPDDYAPMISKEHGVPEGQTTMFSDIREAVRESVKDTGTRAKVLTEEPDVKRKKFKAWDWVKEHILDNGMVFEDLAKEYGNRALEEKWNFIRNSRDMAQHLIGKGNERVKSLNSIRKIVEDSGKVKQFYDYMYHKHNIARMSLAERDFGDNKAVFADYVTWEESYDVANRYEAENPEFKDWAQDVYDYMNYLRDLLVEGGVISQDTADLWAEMYPHYVPIRRDGFNDMDIVVPLDSKRTGANNPVKRAKGGNQDILPMFDTIAMRTLQTYRAIARNQFGVELKNTLGTTIEHDFSSLEEYLQMLETEDSLETLLKKGEKGESPTFTVFEDGQKVEFEITDEIYEALKPKSPASQWSAPIVSAWSDLFRKLTTEYNPTFILTNPIKDVQDINLNSQHPVKTYANIPRSIWQQVSNGTYYKEYIENGGESYSYFDNDTNTFVEDSKLIEALKLPLKPISFLNNHIEMTPRLAEYIASREAGKSIEGAMLDAARVTTNFAAGGDWAKFINRNGVPFFNASIQGAIQQVRNVREAHHKGLMGYVGLAARFAASGLPALILNNALWDEDEDYEKLADYVKQDYYIVAKYDDGKFFRIPKGRAVSVIQNAMEQVQNAITGDDEVDLGNFLKLAAANIAPNNPFENNIVAPIFQVFANKTWYDEELVPSRLQDLPAIEQHDEKTDQFSVWFAEKMNEISGGKVNISPKQMTYLLNQYSGGVGDFLLPMVTPKAESGDDSFVGQMLAPFRDKFTTDSVINNQTTTDFRDLQDSLKVTANSKNATQEDMFRSMYIDSISYELNDLYAEKRDIQTSGRSDSVKYRLAREIQEQINEIMEHALSTYNDVSVDGKYATVSDRRYNYDAEKDTWYQIKEKNADGTDNYYYQKEQEVTKAFDISYSDYWNNREAYDDAYWFATSYDKNIVNTAKLVFGVDDFVSYANEMKDINGKDKDGNSVNGLKKERIIDYCNNLAATYGEKIILFKSQYPKDDTYNYDIIDYLNSRDDISYREMKTILEELGFKVDSKGNITWD